MKYPSSSLRRSARHGFTLVEIMVSTAVLALLMAMLLGTVSQTNAIWRRTAGKISQFQSSRAAFDNMTRALSQATLNTYWVPNPPRPSSASALFRWVPKDFARDSDLHFVSAEAGWLLNPSDPSGKGAERDPEHPTQGVFFQAPLGATDMPAPSHPELRKYDRLEHLLTACGYFLEWGKNDGRPDFLEDIKPALPARWRMRLMEVHQPSEALAIFGATGKVDPDGNDTSKTTDWIQLALGKPVTGFTPGGGEPRVMAENIVALIILPKKGDRAGTGSVGKLDLATQYYYDSRPANAQGKVKSGVTPDTFTSEEIEWAHQLPPVVQVTMVAIDERSADFYQSRHSSGSGGDVTVDAPEWTGNLFRRVNTVEDFRSDLAELETALRKDRMNYRIFSSDVVIRGSKWTHQEQASN